MKYLVAILFSAVLTGCGNSASSETKPMTTDERFISMSHSAAPLTKTLPDEQLVQLGRSACESMVGIDSKASMAFWLLTFNGEVTTISDTESSKIVGLSIAAYCPEMAKYLS